MRPSTSDPPTPTRNRTAHRKRSPSPLHVDDLDRETGAVVGGRGIPPQPPDDPGDRVWRIRRDLRLEPLQDRCGQLCAGALAGREPPQRIAEQADRRRRRPPTAAGDTRDGGQRRHHGRRQRHRGRGTRRRKPPARTDTNQERERGGQSGTGHPAGSCKPAADFPAGRQTTTVRPGAPAHRAPRGTHYRSRRGAPVSRGRRRRRGIPAAAGRKASRPAGRGWR